MDTDQTMDFDVELNETDWLLVKRLGIELQDRLVLCKTVHNFKSNVLYVGLEKKDFSSGYNNSQLDNVPTKFQCGFKKCKKEYTASEFLVLAEKYKASIKNQKRSTVGTPNRNSSQNKNWHEMTSSDTDSFDIGFSDNESIVFTTQAPPTLTLMDDFVPVPDSSVILKKKVSLSDVSNLKKVSPSDVSNLKKVSLSDVSNLKKVSLSDVIILNTTAVHANASTNSNAVKSNTDTVKKQLFKMNTSSSSDTDSSFPSTGTFVPPSNSKSQNESETIQENIYLKDRINQLENQIKSLASQVGLLTNQLSLIISSKTIPSVTNQANISTNVPAMKSLPNQANISTNVPAMKSLPNQSNISTNVPAMKSLSTIPSQTASVQPLSWAAITALPNPTTHARLKAKENAQHPDRKEGFEALRNLIVKSQPKKSKESMPTAVLHVAGLPFVKYSVIWNLFQRARFQTSRIFNMQWIGKSIVEFIVDQTYKIQFEAEIMEFRGRIINFDPSKNVKASTPEQATHAKRCFVIRCVKNILYSQNILVKNHFEKLINDAQQSDPETKLLMDEEMEKGLKTKQLSIESLVASLTFEEMEASIYKSKITDLRRLAANHPLILSYNSTIPSAPSLTSTNIIISPSLTTTNSITTPTLTTTNIIIAPTLTSTTADGGSTDIGYAAMDIDNDPSGDC